MQHDDPNITLRIELRYGNFDISLADWIADEMYREPGLRISRVFDESGAELSTDVVPEAYRPEPMSRRHDGHDDAQNTLFASLRASAKRLFVRGS